MWRGKKANLRDLIAATGLVIFLKLDSNLRFLDLCDLQVWWKTSKNNTPPILYNTKLCASFQSHWRIQTRVTVLLCHFNLCASLRSHLCIQTGVMVWKRPNWAKIGLTSITLTFCMAITFVNSWKFQDMMRVTLSKRCDGRADRGTDRGTDRKK